MIGVSQVTNRTQSLSKMMCSVQNEMLTFEIDSEIALVGCTLERERPLVELVKEKGNLVHSRWHSQSKESELSEACAARHFHVAAKDAD